MWTITEIYYKMLETVTTGSPSLQQHSPTSNRQQL